MARVTLTPTILAAQSLSNAVAANFTTLAAAGSAPSGTGVGNGVQFANFPGQTLLLISTGAATTAAPQVVVGTTLYGQAASPITFTLGSSAINVAGPFYSATELQLAGTSGLVAVDFLTSITNILCAAVQLSGVY
jgi:hypothetical protein